jgi:hypothetical protein
MPQLQIILLVTLLSLLTGCKSNHGEHQGSIGKVYSFTSFTLTSSAGGSFSFSAGEMRALEAVWYSPPIPRETDIANTVFASSPKMAYAFVLDDGYKESMEAYLGTVSGSDYIIFMLQGDGGGFMGDVHSELVPLASILSPKRRSELISLFGIVDVPLP